VAVIEYDDGEREMVDMTIETFRPYNNSDDDDDDDDEDDEDDNVGANGRRGGRRGDERKLYKWWRKKIRQLMTTHYYLPGMLSKYYGNMPICTSLVRSFRGHHCRRHDV
jgi:hypothetical protein